MTIPDELVQAAAEALMADHEWDAMAEANREVALQLTEKDARIALQAAFAKLGEMERHVEVETPHWSTKVRCSCGHEEPSRAQMWKHQVDALRTSLSTLARKFGGRE